MRWQGWKHSLALACYAPIGYTKVEMRIKEGERRKRENFLRGLTLCFSVLVKRWLSAWSFFSSLCFSNPEFLISLVLSRLKEIPNANSW